jgi:hypothetical protein
MRNQLFAPASGARLRPLRGQFVRVAASLLLTAAALGLVALAVTAGAAAGVDPATQLAWTLPAVGGLLAGLAAGRVVDVRRGAAYFDGARAWLRERGPALSAVAPVLAFLALQPFVERPWAARLAAVALALAGFVAGWVLPGPRAAAARR